MSAISLTCAWHLIVRSLNLPVERPLHSPADVAAFGDNVKNIRLARRESVDPRAATVNQHGVPEHDVTLLDQQLVLLERLRQIHDVLVVALALLGVRCATV